MSDATKIAARDISESILEITGQALITGDFDAFAAVFHVPQYMATMAGPVLMQTREDMHRAFEEMHGYFKMAGITFLDREVTDSRYVSATRIESTHVSNTMSADRTRKGPYPVFSVIERVDGTWKVTSSEYVVEPDSAQAKAIAAADASARPQDEIGAT